MLDDNGDAVTALDDGYYIAWTSSTEATATVTSSGDLTAVVKAVKSTSGTTTITATLMKRTAAGDVYTFTFNGFPISIRFDGTYQEYPETIAKILIKKLDDIAISNTPVKKTNEQLY